MDSESYKKYELLVKTGSASLNQFTPYVSEMGLIGTHALEDKDFLKLGLAIKIAKRRVGWLWIDFLIDGEKRWGENFAQVIQLFGEFSPKTLIDNINLGKRDFPLPQRKYRLSPAHYRETRSLPAVAQATLLKLAEENQWGSSITLRNEVKKIREQMEPMPTSPADSHADEELAEIDTETSLDDENPDNLSVKWGIETGGDKNQIANQLALFLQRFEYADYGFYTLSIEIIKTGNYVLDNQPEEGVS